MTRSHPFRLPVTRATWVLGLGMDVGLVGPLSAALNATWPTQDGDQVGIRLRALPKRHDRQSTHSAPEAPRPQHGDAEAPHLAHASPDAACPQAMNALQGALAAEAEPPLCVLLAGAGGRSPGQGAEPNWRQALDALQLPYAVLTGDERQQLNAAMAAVRHAWARAQRGPETEADRTPRWRWVCADCDDGDCEQHLLAPQGWADPIDGRAP